MLPCGTDYLLADTSASDEVTLGSDEFSILGPLEAARSPESCADPFAQQPTP